MKTIVPFTLTAAGAFILSLAVLHASGARPNQAATSAEATAGTGSGAAAESSSSPIVKKHKKIIIEDVEPAGGKGEDKEVAWLGVSTEEVPEAVAAQLGLKSGEGLLVTFVAPNSPAATGGLKKNDVLSQFGDQTLLLPAQLRKLVRMHKESDQVHLTLYRAGKKQTVSVTLGKTTEHASLLPDEDALPGELRELKLRLGDLKLGEGMHEGMKAVREALAKAGIDREQLQIEIRRSMESAHKALEEARRQMSNVHGSVRALAMPLPGLPGQGANGQNQAIVIFKNDRQALKTLAKTDESGALVIVANPKKHLTAHDRDGKLLFDGEIETPEQQAKVPKDLWEKVQPMIEQMDQNQPEKGRTAEEAEERETQ
jgi:hypothetical protein